MKSFLKELPCIFRCQLQVYNSEEDIYSTIEEFDTDSIDELQCYADINIRHFLNDPIYHYNIYNKSDITYYWNNDLKCFRIWENDYEPPQ